MKNLLKRFYDNIYNCIFRYKIILNNPYFKILKIFIQDIRLQIIVYKKNFIKFKLYLYNLNLIKFFLLVYFFFLGIIPFLIIISFWFLILYLCVYNLLLIIDLFFFNFLLIYTNNNKKLKNFYKFFQKIKKQILLFFEKIYNLIINFFSLLLNFLSINWWYIIIKKYIIKPIDKLLCRVLESISKFFIFWINFFKSLIKVIFKFILIVKDKWLLIYKPNLKKIIIKFKLLQFFKFNWIKHFAIIINWIFICKNLIKFLLNKWFWLYFFRFYFYDIFVYENIIKIKFIFLNFIFMIKYITYCVKIQLNTFYYFLKLNLNKYKILYFYYTFKYLLNILFININKYFNYNTIYIILKLYIFKKIITKRISYKIFYIQNNLIYKLLLHHKYLYIFYKLYIMLVYKYII